MKPLLLISILFLAISFLYRVAGQIPVKQTRTDKPLLFAHLPGRIEIQAHFFEQAFALNKGENFQFILPGNFELRGIVLEKVNPSPGTIAINLRIQNYKDALFSLTITTNSENQQFIRARVIHRQYADVLILQLENGRYFLEKQDLRLVLTE